MKIQKTIVLMDEKTLDVRGGDTIGKALDRELADALDDPNVQIQSYAVSFSIEEWSALRMIKRGNVK